MMNPVLPINRQREVDLYKGNYISPYERNLLVHFGMLESIHDYVFSNLEVTDNSVNYPLMISECLGNADISRNSLLEQLFECYNVPSVFIGADILMSYYSAVNYDLQRYKTENALLVQLGH